MTTHAPEQLAQAIDTLYRMRPDALLVGSLGRAAHFGRLTGDPSLEFRQRGQAIHIDPDGKHRDIDVIVPPPTKLPSFIGETAIDDVCFLRPVVSIVRESDGACWLISRVYNFAEPLHPSIMEPVKATTVFGFPCLVPPAQTMRQLSGVPTARPKDMEAARIMDSVGFTGNLPQELYVPFEQLRHIANTSLTKRLGRIYRGTVPLPVRKAVRSILPGVRDSLTALEHRILR